MKATLIMITAILLFAAGNAFAQKAPSKPTTIKSCNICHKDGKPAFAEYKTFLKENHANAATIAESSELFEVPEVTDDCKTCHVDKFAELADDFDPKDVDCMACHDGDSSPHEIAKKVDHPQAAEAEE